MPEAGKTAEEIRHTINRYIEYMCKSDIDGIMSLYADDATVEDPVGTAVLQGREVVRAFYAKAAPSLQVELTGPIRVAGRECAMPMLAELDLGAKKLYLDVVDVMKFDDDGKVISMRAFWNSKETRPTRSVDDS